MATTAGTTRPIVGVGGPGGTAAGVLWHGEAATALTAGDVLIITSNELALGNADPAVDVVIGVAAEDAADGDRMMYWPNLPGVRFEANITAAGPVDDVGAKADHILIVAGIQEDGTDGNAVLELGGGGVDLAHTIEWARQHNVTQDADPAISGVGITNPRVVFVFINGVLHKQLVA
ncbi:MAG: hypothetical protein V3S43_06310 [Acidimicrobiia bacterium]